MLSVTGRFRVAREQGPARPRLRAGQFADATKAEKRASGTDRRSPRWMGAPPPRNREKDAVPAVAGTKTGADTCVEPWARGRKGPPRKEAEPWAERAAARLRRRVQGHQAAPSRIGPKERLGRAGSPWAEEERKSQAASGVRDGQACPPFVFSKRRSHGGASQASLSMMFSEGRRDSRPQGHCPSVGVEQHAR